MNDSTITLTAERTAITEPSSSGWLARQWPGLALATALGITGLLLAQWGPFQHAQISALTIAIVLGIALGNALGTHLPQPLAPGVITAQQKLLRLGVILYGLRLSFAQIAAIGPAALFVDLVMVISTLTLAYWLGRRVFGLDRDSALLTGIGSAICGAAAVLALERVLKPDPGKVAMAVATVVLFGTIDIFLYPWLYPHLGMDAHHFGLYTGASVHEVAQVIAAASAISPATADTAVVVKLTRVLLLVPALFIFGAMAARGGVEGEPRARIRPPWFALVFVLVSIFNSMVVLPTDVRHVLLTLDTFLLAAAMAALGLETRVAKLRALGLKPLLLATTLWIWLMGTGFVLVHTLT